VARAARSLLNKSENERSSVLSSTTKFLSLYHDDLVAANTAACDFRIEDLMHHERPVSLYLTVPPSDLSRTRPLLRLLINQIGRRLTEHMHFRDGAPVPGHRHRLLLMLDEFPTLGRLDFFQTQLSYLPGYGIKAFLIVQDLSQLYAAYGHDESIVSNCHIRVAHAPNKVETAHLLSDMAGATTYWRADLHGNRLNLVRLRWHPSRSPTARSPHPGRGDALSRRRRRSPWLASGRPGTKFRYFRNPLLAARARIPVPAASDRLAGPEPGPWTGVAPEPEPIEKPQESSDDREATQEPPAPAEDSAEHGSGAGDGPISAIGTEEEALSEAEAGK
jgi:type IV secretion system protein VirD4